MVILQKQYQNFLKKHPDGQISRKSFHAMMKECYPGTDTEKLERHIFRMYDTNKVCHSPRHSKALHHTMILLFQDGHIDFREFMIVLYIMSNGTPQDNLKQIFKVFDINNDGFISLKELQRIVKDLFHLINEENADEASQELLAQSGIQDCVFQRTYKCIIQYFGVLAFNEMDENHDGQVSEEEFIEVR